MTKKQKIKELERRIEALENNKWANDFNTGIFYPIDLMAVIKCEVEVSGLSLWGGFTYYIDYQKRYFKKGTEPKIDLIMIDRNGKETYIKNNVSCDAKGKLICKKQ